MNKYSFSSRSDDLCLDFNAFHYWESIEDIITLLKVNRFQVEVLHCYDGPASRGCNIRINGLNFSIQYDSYGAFIMSLERQNDNFLRDIKVRLENLPNRI